MSEYEDRTMRIHLTIHRHMEGYDKVTIGIDVAPFGLPAINYKRILTLGADSLEEAFKKAEIVNRVLEAFFRLEGLRMLRPEEEVRCLESTAKRDEK